MRHLRYTAELEVTLSLPKHCGNCCVDSSQTSVPTEYYVCKG